MKELSYFILIIDSSSYNYYSLSLTSFILFYSFAIFIIIIITIISLLIIYHESAYLIHLYPMNSLYLLISIPIFYSVVSILIIEVPLFLINFSLIDSLIIQFLVNIFY